MYILKIKFLYIHPGMTDENILGRITWLKANELLPYAMRDRACWSSPKAVWYSDISSWCNQPGMFKKKTFDEFMAIRYAYRLPKQKGLF